MRVLLLLVPWLVINPAWAGEPLGVFVSILPQRYLAERIGGEYIEVSVMVQPGASPATYEPRPRQMTRLAKAELYFRIGVPFERAWMDRLRSINPDMEVVATSQGIERRHMGTLQGSGSERGLADPHVWTSPPLAKLVARNMRDALVRHDPGHAAAYREGYQALAADLDQLHRDIRAILRDLDRRSFMVFHPSWGYFADTYGLKQIPIEIEGKAPSARQLARIIDKGRREEVSVIFVQRQFSRDTAEAVADAIGAEVVQVDPLAADYIANMRRVARAFAAALDEA